MSVRPSGEILGTVGLDLECKSRSSSLAGRRPRECLVRPEDVAAELNALVADPHIGAGDDPDVFLTLCRKSCTWLSFSPSSPSVREPTSPKPGRNADVSSPRSGDLGQAVVVGCLGLDMLICDTATRQSG